LFMSFKIKKYRRKIISRLKKYFYYTYLRNIVNIRIQNQLFSYGNSQKFILKSMIFTRIML